VHRDYDPFETILDRRHPNNMVFDNIGNLYIGDSLGVVHVWSITVKGNYSKLTHFKVKSQKLLAAKIQTIQNEELKGDPINCIHWLQTNQILVHSRDNCIRLIEIGNDESKVYIYLESNSSFLRLWPDISDRSFRNFS